MALPNSFYTQCLNHLLTCYKKKNYTCEIHGSLKKLYINKIKYFNNITKIEHYSI